MSFRERTEVQEPIEKGLRGYGWDCYRTVLAGERGWPDTTAHRNGDTLYVESKLPGEEPSPNQRRIHAMLRAAGMRVIVAERWEDVEPHAR